MNFREQKFKICQDDLGKNREVKQAKAKHKKSNNVNPGYSLVTSDRKLGKITLKALLEHFGIYQGVTGGK